MPSVKLIARYTRRPSSVTIDQCHGGGEEVVEEAGLLSKVDEDEVPLPIQVHGQRARRSRPFHVNLPTDSHGLVQPQSHRLAEGQWQHCGWVGDARVT